MNDCEFYQELISRMLDADLTAEEEAALKSHLESCPECRMLYEAFSDVSGIISGSLEEPPETLHENIMAELRRSEIKKKNRRVRPILTAAACFAVVLLGVFGLRNTLFAAKAAAPMMQAAVSGDMAAAEAAPAELPAAPAPAPAAAAPAAGQNSVFFAMAAPVEAFSAEAAAAEESAEAEMTTDAKEAAEAEEGEYIRLADLKTMEALRVFLSGESTEAEEGCRLLYTVFCEEDESELRLYERSDRTVICLDSRDGGWFASSCTGEACGNFLAELCKK